MNHVEPLDKFILDKERDKSNRKYSIENPIKIKISY